MMNLVKKNFERLKLLSQLELTEQYYITAFLAELHGVTASDSNSFFWLNNKHQVNKIYDEHNFFGFNQGLTAETRQQLSTILSDKLSNDCQMEYSLTQQESAPCQFKEIYQQIVKPFGYQNSLIVPICNEQKKCIGILILNRKDTTPFSYQEIIQTIDCREIIEAQFATPILHTKQKMTSGWECGLAIVNKKGELLDSNPSGKKLLGMATQHTYHQFTQQDDFDIRNIEGIYDAIQHLLIPQKSLRIARLKSCNDWGEFCIDGFPILDEKGKRAPRIYLHIRWSAPFCLKIFHNLQFFDFTARQATVALLYAIGKSTNDISKILEISHYTVKEHIQNIFDKLFIHTRTDLIEHIICQEQQIQEPLFAQLSELNRAE